MKKLTLLNLIILISGALILSSCEKEEETPVQPSIVELAVDNGFNVLAAAVVAAGLDDDLSGAGPFTLFAPTDAAFNAAGITANNVSGVPGLESILKYHVIAGFVPSSSLTSGSVTMLSGADAVIDADNLKINTASIMAPFDIEGRNGVIHTIDEVLTPPVNIVQTAIAAGYNVLAAGLVAASLDDDLQGEGPFTVFAPTDAAFNAAGITAENIGDLPGLAEILLYHVVSGTVRSTDLSTGDFATLNSQDISIDASALTVNGLSIASPFDVEATNGVIHTLDGVLIPQFDLVTSALFYGYNTLAAAVIEADLVDALRGAGPFTVFAPTDEAFSAIGITPANVSTVAGLQGILLYHVVSGQVMSGDLSTGEVESLSGKFLSIDASALTVDNAGIVSPFDFKATNGVIHTIDEVLLPAKNIVETAQGTDDLSSLVTILELYPDLVTALTDETGTYTVFAPTNAAFASLLGVIGQTSVSDIPADVLRAVLEYHVLASEVYSTNLSAGLTAATIGGEEIEVTAEGSSFLISGAGINTPDIETSNGVVHMMDAVLVPPTVAMFVNTIVEPAYFNKNFSTLIAAVKAASPSILDLLLSSGPSGNGMTLFAPTNDAFTAAGITELPGQATLDAVLAYHLLDGVVMSNQLPATSVAAPVAITSAGGEFYLSNSGSGVFLNGNTQVVATDIDPSEGAGTANGVVHVIDRTLVPPSQDVVEIAIAGGFSELANALTVAGLVSTLQGEGAFTVFAPTDEAFGELYAALGVDGPDQLPLATLQAVLLYHVVGARVFSTDLVNGLEPVTVGGESFTVNVGETSVTISDGANSDPDAVVTNVNILGTNGVIHVINKVILPPAN